MCYFVCILLVLGFVSCSSAAQVFEIPTGNLTFIILSQDNSFHQKLVLKKHHEILKQSQKFNVSINIYSTHDEFLGIVGYWTIFPLIKRLSQCNQCSWFFFCEDTTYINLGRLLEVLSTYNASSNVFAGYALRDREPTIIHHFVSSDSSGILYPHFSSGFFLSSVLVKKLASRLPHNQDSGFSIDPKYEFANFVWDAGAGTKLSHEPHLCILKENLCATWIESQLLICEDASLPEVKIFVAVKTCKKFHKDRVKVVKNTWAKDAKHLVFFSNVKDESIPTIKLDVENVKSGHCEKTLEIMRYYAHQDIVNDWIAIVDDDTLLSFPRLKKVLSCYNSSEKIALGEKYGYTVISGLGYDYITGGGGMVFSMPTVREIVASCHCPSIDSPDDMILGMCLKKLGIPVIHSPFFHQARPIDYSEEFLKPLKHVSFHKHWMIDTDAVYSGWLAENKTSKQHSEL